MLLEDPSHLATWALLKMWSQPWCSWPQIKQSLWQELWSLLMADTFALAACLEHLWLNLYKLTFMKVNVFTFCNKVFKCIISICDYFLKTHDQNTTKMNQWKTWNILKSFWQHAIKICNDFVWQSWKSNLTRSTYCNM